MLRYALVCSLVAATPCRAQIALEASPFVGTYQPTGAVPQAPPFQPTPCDQSGGGIVVGDLRKEASTEGLFGLSDPPNAAARYTFGGRLALWMGNWVGVEGSVRTGNTEFISPRLCADGTYRASYPFLATDARLLVRLLSVSRARLYVLGGPALVRYTADAAQYVSSSTGYGAVVGVALLVRLTSLVSFRADLEDTRYSYEWEQAPTGTRWQNDIALTLSLSLRS